jgi:hypothetical protein
MVAFPAATVERPMSNVTPLFPAQAAISIEHIYQVTDELGDAALKKHGLTRGPVWLAVTEDIANEVCARNKMTLSVQGFHFTATLMNVIKFRIASVVLALNHLTDLNDLAENAAKHGLLPTEDEFNAQPLPEDD